MRGVASARGGITPAVHQPSRKGLSRLLLDSLELSRFFGAVVGLRPLASAKPDAAPTWKRVNAWVSSPELHHDCDSEVES